MTAAWPYAAFEDACTDETGGNLKTPQSKFAKTGKYPIVDQGKDLVAGYTDDGDCLCRTKLPVVVFGDHTRAVKFVDFPFCLGADGTKVLRPSKGVHGKFLYHFLRYIDLPDTGYSRHFKFLKRVKVPLPSIPEQRRIAAILDGVDTLRAKRQTTLTQLDELAPSLFLSMFGDPISNTRQLPSQPLGAVANFLSGGTPSKEHKEYWGPGLPWV